MGNLTLAYPNRVDAATLSGGAWETSLPLANLQDTRLHIPARSVDLDAASTLIDVDLGSTRTLGLVALYKHNLSLTAQYRVRGSAVADFASHVYDSGWTDAWGVAYDNSTLVWESENWWTGQHTEETLEQFPRHTPVILPDGTRARYWRIEIDDADNADGYVQIARLFVSETWAPTWNYSYGAAFGASTNTAISQALSNAEYFDRRDPWREFAFSLDWLTDAEAYQRAFELQWRQGMDQEIYLIPDPDDAQNMIRRAYLGRLERLNPIQHPQFATHSAAFTIKERL